MRTIGSPLNVGEVLQRVANARLQAEDRARHADLTSVLAINSHVGALASPEQLLLSIAQEAARLLNVADVWFRLCKGDELVVAGVVGAAAGTVLRPRIGIGEGASGQVLSARRALAIDLDQDQVIDPATRHAMRQAGYSYYLGVPLLLGERNIGVLGFLARRPFGSRDIEVAQAFASQAAVAVEHGRLYQEATRRAERTRALAEVGRLLSSTLDLEVLSERILASLGALVGATHASLYRLPPDAPELVLVNRTGSAHAWRQHIPLSDGLIGLAVNERRPMTTPDLVADRRITLPPDVRASLAHTPHRAGLAVPLCVGEHVLGVLCILDVVGRAWEPEEVQLAQSFADQAALALRNAQLHEEAVTSVSRLEALVEVNRVVGSTLDHHAVAARVVETAQQLIPECVSTLWERVPGSGELRRIAVRGTRHAPPALDRLAPGEGLAGTVVTSGARIISADLANDSRVSRKQWFLDEGLVSGVTLPLLHAGVEYGALCLFSRVRYELTESEIKLLESFAAQVAAAIANAHAFSREEERARRLATLTELTRLITSAGSREVFDAVAMAAARLLGASFARVLVHDVGASMLITEGAFSADPDLAQRIRSLPPAPIHGGLAGKAFTSQAPVFARDVEADQRSLLQTVSRGFGLRAAALIPLRTGDRVVGVLSIGFDEPRDFSPEEKELMDLLADQAAIAINNKRGEDELRALAAAKGNILASITSILIAVDRQDRITGWNAAAETTLGIAADRVVGRPLLESGIEWQWPAVLEGITACRERKTPIRLDGLRYQRPDGKEGLLTLTVNPIVGDEAIWEFLILADDVTERRFLEAQLAQAQKLESIGQLAAGIAHEINTPIQFVGDNVRFLEGATRDLQNLLESYQGLLRDGAADDALHEQIRAREAEIDVTYLASEIPSAVAQTLDGVQRVATIVRALKEFAHPDRSEIAAVDLNRAILSTLAVARNEIKYVADVETDLGDLPPVMCCAGELNQVFLNLIINAAHAIGDVVREAGGKGRIGVRTRQDGHQVVVAISDTGRGIPEAIRSRIFDPFFTTKEVGRGTGQGLAIARHAIVDKHGGSLTFETERGRGTTFFIRLPIAPPTS